MTAQLSRERLEQIASWEIEITDAGTRHAPVAHSKVYSYEIVEMARMMLAGMDSEPVAYFYPGDETEWQGVALAEELDDEQKSRCIPLYAAPPAPVADEDSLNTYDRFVEGWNACRAAMLKAGPVTGWIKCSERMPPLNNGQMWIYSPTRGVKFMFALAASGEYYDTCDSEEDITDATHWVPIVIPAVPEEEV